MELKEQAGDKDLYDVLKKKKKTQKKNDTKSAKTYASMKAKEKVNVFDFINKKLKGKKGKLFHLTVFFKNDF